MAERILVKDVLGKLDNHLHRHEDKYDSMLERHDTILFGKDGDDGITSEVKDMGKLKKDIHDLKWILLGAVAVQLLMGVVFR